MNNSAINPAAACPDWCTAGHEPNHFTAWPNGDWDVTHTGTPIPVETGEDVGRGVAFEVSVRSESFTCNNPSECHGRSIWVISTDTDGNEESFLLTARQALRLAEVLVHQAAAVLAEESVSLEVTR